MTNNIIITKLVMLVFLAVAIFDIVECQPTEPTPRCTCNTNAYTNGVTKTVNHGGSHGCDITLSCSTGYNIQGGLTKVYCEDGLWIDEDNSPRDLSSYSCQLNIVSVSLAVVGIVCVAVLFTVVICCAYRSVKRRGRRRPASEPIRKYPPVNNNVSFENTKVSMTNLSELEPPKHEYSKPIPSRRPLDLPRDRTIERNHRTLERLNDRTIDRTDQTIDPITSTPKKQVTNPPSPDSKPMYVDDKKALIAKLEKDDTVEVDPTPDYDQNVTLDSEDDLENQNTIEESFDVMMNNSETKLTRL
ncbi:uncharacterized protein [Amphiura filiformis]|uniref:uncharacterized protein n=1 Tax=Amphiura filiformis TaxID=82378 RepID=UPI003B20FD89